MPTPKMTEDEIISVLERASLPTLLVEGKDDEAIYRGLEDRLGLSPGSIFFCSGREVLTSIYRKRDSFRHGRLACLADLDMWLFSSPPADLDGIIFTAGYSIENDLYAGSDVESLMDGAERVKHGRLLATACRWFAFEVGEHLAGRGDQCATHIKEVVDLKALEIKPEFIEDRGFAEPASALVEQIQAQYKLLLRGKTLVDVLEVSLNAPGRRAQHRRPAILEMCLRLYPDNPYVRRIADAVTAKLA